MPSVQVVYWRGLVSAQAGGLYTQSTWSAESRQVVSGLYSVFKQVKPSLWAGLCTTILGRFKGLFYSLPPLYTPSTTIITK